MDGLDGVLGGLCAITSRHECTNSVGRRLALNRSGFVCHGLDTRAYTVEQIKGLMPASRRRCSLEEKRRRIME
jgi:hypothetical protein